MASQRVASHNHGAQSEAPVPRTGKEQIMNTSDTPMIECSVCCKEIPLDAAFTPEGGEYVGHFCGPDCYQRFVARAGSKTAPQPGQPDAGAADNAVTK
jgi:hypothetical protein